jgi:hypothetical protein
MDDDDDVTPADRNRIVAAARGSHDRFLEDLLELAGLGFGLSVGLLLNGMVVFGALGRPEDAAEDLSAARGTAFANTPKSDDITDEEWDEARRNFVSQPRRQVEGYREATKELDAEIAGRDFAELPAALARRAVELNIRGHVTLRDVNILAAGAPAATHIPVMRVALRHISAWWPLHFDETGKSTTKMWGGA